MSVLAGYELDDVTEDFEWRILGATSALADSMDAGNWTTSKLVTVESVSEYR